MRPSKVAPGELGLLAGSVRIGTDNRCAAEKCGPRARRSARVSLAQPPSKPRPANKRHTLIANRRRHAAPPPPRASPRTASELRSCVVVPASGRDWPLVDPGLDLGAAPADGAAAWASEEDRRGEVAALYAPPKRRAAQARHGEYVSDAENLRFHPWLSVRWRREARRGAVSGLCADARTRRGRCR